MRLYYATHDGQSRLIATRIARRLTESGRPVAPIDLAESFPDRDELAAARMVILVCPVRYGYHLRPGSRLLAACRDLAAPLVVASVNLTARKPGKDTPQGNLYLAKWLRHCRVQPTLTAAFAGRLDYPRYGWLDRQMIRLIMKMTGGPTDPSAQIEYTDWDRVDAFADDIARLYDRTQTPVKHAVTKHQIPAQGDEA